MVRLCNIVTWTKFSCRRSFCGQQATPGAPVLGHIASDGARRDPNSHFQQQLGGDAFLAPSRVVITHFHYQVSEVRQGYEAARGSAISASRTVESLADASR